MKDTNKETAQIQIDILKRMTGSQRMGIAFEMSLTAKELSLTRLRQQHPGWTEKDLMQELLRYAFLPHKLPESLR